MENFNGNEMKILKIKKIENTISFDSLSGTYAYVNDSKKMINVCDSEFEMEELPIFIRERNGVYYLLKSNGECFKSQNELEYKPVEKIPYCVSLDIFSGNYLYVYEYDENFDCFFNLIDFQTDKLVLNKFSKYKLASFQNYLFGYGNFNHEISRLRLDNTFIWQFNLSKLGNLVYEEKPDNIEKIVGVAFGNVWLDTNGGRLVALDVETGEVTKKYSCYKEDLINDYNTNLKIGKYIYLNETDESIYGMSSSHFQKINTRTLNIEEEFCFETDFGGMDKFEYIYTPLLQGNYFTFLASKPGDFGGIRHVGLFDYKEKKLVWEYEVISQEECNATRNALVRPQPLYMTGNKLYIKDFKNNLHVFEKIE